MRKNCWFTAGSKMEVGKWHNLQSYFTLCINKYQNSHSNCCLTFRMKKAVAKLDFQFPTFHSKLSQNVSNFLRLQLWVFATSGYTGRNESIVHQINGTFWLIFHTSPSYPKLIQLTIILCNNIQGNPFLKFQRICYSTFG